jgi:hypothetical protein
MKILYFKVYAEKVNWLIITKYNYYEAYEWSVRDALGVKLKYNLPKSFGSVLFLGG